MLFLHTREIRLSSCANLPILDGFWTQVCLVLNPVSQFSYLKTDNCCQYFSISFISWYKFYVLKHLFLEV